MAGFRLLIKPSAAKEIEAVGTKKDRRRIVSKILSLRHDPRPSGCHKLKGSEKYRIRQGPYRILYSIQDDFSTVTIVKVGHRKEIYRK